MNTSTLTRIALLSTIAAATSVFAAPQSFDFRDPKGVNNVQFSLDAPLESITGTANGVSGSILFDPAAPAAVRGKIVVAASSLAVGNPLMREHLHGANWLDVETYPEITFEASEIANVRSQGPQSRADVTGRLTLKGVTRQVTVPVTFTHLPDKLGARLGDETVKGDLLVLRANFTIDRSDYNIMPGQADDKVAETIQLSLAIAGAARK